MLFALVGCLRVPWPGRQLTIDTHLGGALRHPQPRVQQHDISAYELPTGRFDLVPHSLLLPHWSTRHDAVQSET